MNHIRETIIVLVILIASVAIGGLLYLFGPSIFQGGGTSNSSTPKMGYTTISEGQNALGIDTRANYRITDADQFSQLWDMVYGKNGPPVPLIDFSSEEVLGIFDGSHTTGGYDITVTSITNEDGKRMVHVLRTQPGENCAVTSAISSPFQIVELPKSDIPLTHTDETQITTC